MSFLSEAFKKNKGIAAGFILFASTQLFINFKRGLVATPFYHFGMYSHPLYVEKEYKVWEIIANNKVIRMSNYTPQQCDRILSPLEYLSNIKKSNNLYETDIKRLLDKFKISTNDKDFIQQCNYSDFEQWYKGYLSKIEGRPITTLSVTKRSYILKDSHLQPTENSASLSSLCF